MIFAMMRCRLFQIFFTSFVGILILAATSPFLAQNNILLVQLNRHVNANVSVLVSQQQATTKLPLSHPSPSSLASLSSLFYYLIDLPEFTSWLIGNYTDESIAFYKNTLNEHQAEVWIHRCFEFNCVGARTLDPYQADVFLIAGYLHLNHHIIKTQRNKWINSTNVLIPYNITQLADLVMKRLVNTSKPHFFLVPTWNPAVANEIGIKLLMNVLSRSNVNIYSVGFERNPFWQKISVDRILPIPYVVTSNHNQSEISTALNSSSRRTDFVFYVGHKRRHAIQWAGCNRSMVDPLTHRQDMYVRIAESKNQRLSQTEYNQHLFSAEYCLILCGDTPTSRSLASAMLYGCIPIQVGSRLEGKCVPPCHPGWGWKVVNHIDHAHLPFADVINYDIFPQVNEANFSKDPVRILKDLLAGTSLVKKDTIRSAMAIHQQAWIYGWGSPTTSTQFGSCVPYIWDSMKMLLNHHII